VKNILSACKVGSKSLISYEARYVIGKGKIYPRTGHEGPEGEYRYSSTLSLTLALDGIGWPTSRPGRFTYGKDPVPIVLEAGWAPDWSGRVGKISPPPGFDPRSESLYKLSYPGPQCTTRTLLR